MVIYENTIVKNLHSDEKKVYISTEGENLISLKVALTCGKWMGELVPDIKEVLSPIEQSLVYVEMKNQN